MRTKLLTTTIMRSLKIFGQSNYKFWIAFFVLSVVVESVFSQKIYYIDSQGGNDLNTGTSDAAAWKTIDKLNSSMSLMKPSDIIEFKRGDVFEGQINLTANGAAGQPLTFDAYGTGSNPVISGATKISGWKKYTNNIYRAKTTKTALNAYINNRELVLARTPNIGNYFTIDASGTTTYFTDAALGQNTNYWNNANCRIRTSDFTWETTKVSSFSGGTVNLQSSVSYYLVPGRIYYFDNLLSSLDTVNEWYASADSLYVYFSNLSDTSNVNASIYAYGMQGTSRSNLLIQNLGFTKQGSDGISLLSCSAIQISNNVFSNIILTSVNLGASSNITVSGNTMTNCRGNGISCIGMTNGNFLSNTIKNIGLVPGYGRTLSGMTAIYINGDGSNNIIKGNQIDSTGYNGIRSDTHDTRIEYNTVRHPMLLINDGAGIYIWGTSSTNVTIAHNYIENIHKSEFPGYHDWSFGIYLDDYSFGDKVIGNIINDKGSTAIFLHNSYNDVVDSNTVYGTCIDVALDATVSGSTYANTITNNNIFTLNEKIPSLNLSSYIETTFGTIENNVYFNPLTKVTIQYSTPSVSLKNFSLCKWRDFSGKDKLSKESFIHWDGYKITDTVGSNLIVNGTFDSNINSWDGYNSNFVREWATNSRLNAGCVRMYFSSTSPTYGAFRTPGTTINYGKGKYYAISFNTVSNSFVSMFLRDNETPSNLDKNIAIDTSLMHHNFIFQAANDYLGKLLFTTALNGTYTGQLYMDNIKMYQVNAQPVNYSDSSVLLSNTDNSLKSFNLGTNKYKDTYGNQYTGTINIDPWKAAILVKTEGTDSPFDTVPTPDPGSGKDSAKVQTIDLKAGWNTISFNVIPKAVKVEEIIQPIVQSGALVKVQDEGGNFMVETDGDWFNNLESIDISKGYNIKVNADCQLKISGSPVPETTTIPLTQGYNIIGYPSSIERKALDCFKTLIDEGSLIKVQDESGNFIIKTGTAWFSNIDSLKPGRGYNVNVNKNTSMSFNYLKSSFTSNLNEKEQESTSYFQKAYKGNPYSSMNFIIKNINQSDCNLTAGDEIGIFDGGICVGDYLYNGENIIGLSAGMADPLLGTLGFTNGDSISIQIYKTKDMVLMKNIGITFNQNLQSIFTTQGTAAVEISKQATTISTNLKNNNSIDNYPNPFYGQTTFEFSMESSANVTLTVYDISGKEVTQLINNKYDSGKYEISWDATNSKGEILNPGVYLYVFKSGSYTSSHKLILLQQ